MTTKERKIGIIGLGVMGRNLVLNFADHGFAVAGYDRDMEKVNRLKEEKEAHHEVSAVPDIKQFVALLTPPRAVLLLVPAGKPVDDVIASLTPHLAPGDLIIDAGNSYFQDTDRRRESLNPDGIHFLGMGVSGGEKGARLGPSIMPGGSPKGYERVKPLLEAAAAKAKGDPCVAYLGAGSAGHYVKMVHNGIEYGIMQLIAESYDFMKRGMSLTNAQLHDVYSEWNRQELDSYLIEITAKIFQKKDERTGGDLVDLILDCADQKGTGMWTAADALNLQEPVPTIDTAVQMRNLSMRKESRRAAAEKLPGPSIHFTGDPGQWTQRLGRALWTAVLITYGQGMAQLSRASETYGYGIDLSVVARIWRGGCIIRSALLDPIMAAFQKTPDLTNLLLDPQLGAMAAERQQDLRRSVETAVSWGVPFPAFMASLAYFDACRSERLPTNLIQAQRDFFGAHTYKRIDMQGSFHTQWE